MGIINEDHSWMRYALQLAQQAAANHEVPVGAVLVQEGNNIGEGWNQPISGCDPTAHAEIIALRQAAKKIGNYRLINTTLYVTLEPCIMCAASLIHARIKRLVFGATDLKAGGVVSVANILDLAALNHRISYQGGILAEESGALLKQFFQERR